MASQQQHMDLDVRPQPYTYERRLGDTELSYYLPSRADGVNDMCIRVGFRAPKHLFTPRRILAAFALLLMRHPLLASHLIPPPLNGTPFETDYSDARFSYTPPSSPTEALRKAASLFELQKDVSAEQLFDRYLNGKRLLSENRLTYLIMTESTATTDDGMTDFAYFFTGTHYCGDSVSFHQFANDFFTLIAGKGFGETCSAMDLEDVVREEWQARWGHGAANAAFALPSPVEDRLPPAGSTLKKAAAKVDFLKIQKDNIGGHALPRTKGAKRKSVQQTFIYDEFTTNAILKRCKSQGVSVSNALFSLAAIAWSRTQLARGVEIRPDLPIMMYTALNLRPHLIPCNSSYWITSLGFFNVILPSWIPAKARSGSDRQSWQALRSTVWHRARSAKKQSNRAAKNPMLVSRAREMANQRSSVAKAFAVEDDAKDMGLAIPRPPQTSSPSQVVINPPVAPSTALLGLSHLGNLDAIYLHKDYPGIQLRSHLPAVRIRPGGLLVFGSTFAGKLHLSLVHDVNGFEDNTASVWWNDVTAGIDELLIGKPIARL